MFLQKEDLKNNIYTYQVEQITEGDDAIVLQALDTAEQEAKSYLTLNNKKEAADGRLKYDVDKIFSAKGKERNPLIVSITLTIAKWWIVDLCNVDIIYEQAKDRYDRAVAWLKDIAKGNANLNTLPLIKDENQAIDDTPDEELKDTWPWIYGSRKKFNHE
ncbi:Protein of unknown function (DUF1320) [Apibacter mensalis]|uniref:DUF1320 domain-containing protein n=1 Tax=Apibacter mensalis TaxID=1586267 RepID=A0A0X3ARZ2_9FLAO|nr:phage protein Gp36 family protein [Apibacter mensalis]CVK17112.1 Protein of unknown function (DUF1320) [Apibacter mensalis]